MKTMGEFATVRVVVMTPLHPLYTRPMTERILRGNTVLLREDEHEALKRAAGHQAAGGDHRTERGAYTRGNPTPLRQNTGMPCGRETMCPGVCKCVPF